MEAAKNKLRTVLAPLNDSFELIKRSRNEILERNTTNVYSKQTPINQPSTIPRVIHLIAVDPKRRFLRHRQQSPTKYIHKSILSIQDLIPISYKPNTRNSKSHETKIERMEEEKAGGYSRRGRSFECNILKKPASRYIENVIKDIKKRKHDEQQIDSMINKIATNNMTFEDMSMKYQITSNHEQMISTIPLDIPTHRYKNVTYPIRGLYNEEESDTTYKAVLYPNIDKTIVPKHLSNIHNARRKVRL